MKKGAKSFFAIIIITMLGVGIFSGLRAACVDLRKSADRFFDEQNLHDFVIQSTLGLTDADVRALEGDTDIKAAEGIYSQTIDLNMKSGSYSAQLQTLSAKGIDMPFAVEGRLPEAVNEAAVTEKMASDMGLKVGDIITIPAEDESADAARWTTTEFTIVGIMIDPCSVNNPFGSVSYRTSSTDKERVWVLPEAVEADAYTAVLVKMTGSNQMFCYGDIYQNKADAVADRIEDEIMTDRETARYNEVKNDAQSQLDEASDEADQQLSDARQELYDSQQELEDQLQEAADKLAKSQETLSASWADWNAGKAQLDAQEESVNTQIADAKSQLASARQTLSDKKSELEDNLTSVQDGKTQAEDALTQAQDGLTQVQDGLTQAQDGLAELTAPADDLQGQIDEAAALRDQLQAEYDSLPPSGEETEEISSGDAGTGTEGDRRAELEQQIADQNALIAQLTGQLGALQEQTAPQEAELQQQIASLQAQETQLEDTIADLQSQLDELSSNETQILSGLAQIEEQSSALDDSEQEIKDNEQTASAQFAEARADLEDARQQLLDGQTQLEDGRQEYADGKEEGEQQISDGWDSYYDNKQKVQDELAEAQEDVDSIEMASWYLQDRGYMSGYSNIQSDADSIESIATVFPIVFFIVAILISMTTVSRIVDEDRGIIGIYKALGFSDREIRRKYLVYTVSAAVIGSTLGTICAVYVLPGILFVVFRTMYVLPYYGFHFVPLFGTLGPAIFMIGILAVTLSSCRSELQQTPALLMRPKAPKQGKRVLLERIRPLWSRMGFLGKVTARNLFRYKKRMFMTVFGIAGCMALLMFGFAVKDSVFNLREVQYGKIFRYDLMAVSKEDGQEELMQYLSEGDAVESSLQAYITSVTITNDSGEELSAQLIVPEDASQLKNYVNLMSPGKQNNKEYTLEDGKIYVTHNAGRILNLSSGSSLDLQLPDLTKGSVQVTGITENLLGNYVYMTRDTYEQVFGTEMEPNGVLAKFSSACKDPEGYGNELEKQDHILTCVTTAEMRSQFQTSFRLMNMVVYVLIVMSAALAFVVLFTLSNTNVSERVRELATIKVLGFYNYEVHHYLNRETIVLTLLGVILGFPLGWAFSQTLSIVLRLPSIQLQVVLHPSSYVFSAGLTVIFAVVVGLIMNRVLDRIDPAEALKSNE